MYFSLRVKSITTDPFIRINYSCTCVIAASFDSKDQFLISGTKSMGDNSANKFLQFILKQLCSPPKVRMFTISKHHMLHQKSLILIKAFLEQ